LLLTVLLLRISVAPAMTSMPPPVPKPE
jgi:hypothetical protein